ncbi:hypothetical protein CLV78_101449 [Aliiruegeria haliotis]|uniref:Extracellular nuclease n=1 Tax=Aliiruegeria haliotis TaxID=1280846 RepID=A0A2T0RYV1_9RHOB|nr:ExeM/NucH family extracellular endonuclease [Aliiruegeria haliotis]PRY26354.1 hypothetical protein CLV78_101449 [Aliiruegeria haliotis]
MSIIFREDFETDGNGVRYFTATPEFSDGFFDFFLRTDGAGIGSAYEVSGQSGASFFAAQDIDGEGGPGSTMIVFSGIDISGYSDLVFSGLFAEDDSSDGNEDWDADSNVLIEVRIDGGGWVPVLQFAESGGTNSAPGLDTDFDGVADGAALTDVFTAYAAAIGGTGSVLDLRLSIDGLSAGDEDIAFDNLMLSGTPAAPAVLDETFDDASKFTTSVGFFSDGSADYLGLSDGAGGGDFGGDPIPSQRKSYTGNDGAYLTGMDLDGEGATLPITVEWTGLDIAGLQDLVFTGDFAEAFDSPGDIDDSDYIRLVAVIDGGPEQELLDFRGADFTSGDFNGNFRLDTDGDDVGDGAVLSDALTEFAANIAGTGLTLDLRLEVSVNAGDEDFAVDNFRIVGTSGGTVTPAVIADAGDGLLVDENGTLTDSFTLALSTVPGDAVTVTIAGDGQSLVSLDGVNFSETLNVVLSDTDAETVQVRAVDDAIGETIPHLGALSFTVSSADPEYDGLELSDLGVSVQDNDVMKIHTVQGSGAASALDDHVVTVEAIVTSLVKTNSGSVVGYFLQEEDADADGDAATSEGIYVFDFGATVSVGDHLRVTARVDEFNGLTELTSVEETLVLSTGNALPTTSVITIGMSDGFEAYEGMRVELISGSTDPLTVIENFNLGRFGSVVMSEGNQYQPTQLFDAQSQATEVADLAAANAANRITIDDGITSQNPDIYRLIDSGDGTPLEAGDPITEAGPTLRLGAQTETVVGVLDYSFGQFRLNADGPLDTIAGTNEGAREPDVPEVGGELKVASFNVLNYFTTLDQPGAGTGPDGTLDPRGADDAGELVRQTAKIVAALTELDADIIGLQELENNGFGTGSAIATLVDELNTALGAEVYAFVDPGDDFVGTDAIMTGIIYKADSVSLVGADTLTFAEASAATTLAVAEDLNPYASSDDQVADLQRNRPATVATFADEDGSEITVVSNHFKSKGDSNLQDLYLDAVNAGAPQGLIDALLADPNYDQGDGQGFWNGVRTDAALELAGWLETNPTGAADPGNIIALGDLNAYAMEDPVQALLGAGYTDLAAAFIGEDAYSFVFNGQRGTLDYGLASGGILDNITGVAEWHINADEPGLLGYDTSFNNPAFYNDDLFAASDHDPMVIGVELDDPTIAARLDFVDGHRWGAKAVYSVDGEEVGARHLGLVQGRINVNKAGIRIDAEDGKRWTPDLLSTLGDGLSVANPTGWCWWKDTSVDNSESVSFSLRDRGGLGDALEVAFEFVDISGPGDVTLEFYQGRALVEVAELNIVDGGVSHDLAGNTSFDKVALSVENGTELEISAVEFGRLVEQDYFGV